MFTSPLIACSLAALVMAQTTIPILGSINPGSIAIPSSLNNPFTIYLTQTNSLGVVTGMPSLITSQPSLITSQPPIATFTNGEGAGVIVSTGTSGGLTSLRTLATLPTILSSGTAIPGGILGGVAGAGGSSSVVIVSSTLVIASSTAAVSSAAATTVGANTITTTLGSTGTSAAAAASASKSGSAAAKVIKISGVLFGLAAFVATLL